MSAVLTTDYKKAKADINEHGYCLIEGALPPEKLDMMVRVKNVPIDQNLVNAIPAEHRYWIKKLGIGGTMDCDGDGRGTRSCWCRGRTDRCPCPADRSRSYS